MTDNKELKAANHRLNERVRELDYALMQCRENSDRHKLQRNEARQWARDLLARAGNLDWVVERVGAGWREDIEDLEKAQKRIAELEERVLYLATAGHSG